MEEVVTSHIQNSLPLSSISRFLSKPTVSHILALE